MVLHVAFAYCEKTLGGRIGESSASHGLTVITNTFALAFSGADIPSSNPIPLLYNTTLLNVPPSDAAVPVVPSCCNLSPSPAPSDLVSTSSIGANQPSTG